MFGSLKPGRKVPPYPKFETLVIFVKNFFANKAIFSKYTISYLLGSLVVLLSLSFCILHRLRLYFNRPKSSTSTKSKYVSLSQSFAAGTESQTHSKINESRSVDNNLQQVNNNNNSLAVTKKEEQSKELVSSANTSEDASLANDNRVSTSSLINLCRQNSLRDLKVSGSVPHVFFVAVPSQKSSSQQYLGFVAFVIKVIAVMIPQIGLIENCPA